MNILKDKTRLSPKELTTAWAQFQKNQKDKILLKILLLQKMIDKLKPIIDNSSTNPRTLTRLRFIDTQLKESLADNHLILQSHERLDPNPEFEPMFHSSMPPYTSLGSALDPIFHNNIENTQHTLQKLENTLKEWFAPPNSPEHHRAERMTNQLIQCCYESYIHGSNRGDVDEFLDALPSDPKKPNITTQFNLSKSEKFIQINDQIREYIENDRTPHTTPHRLRPTSA
jgi:hypothetical protein